MLLPAGCHRTKRSSSAHRSHSGRLGHVDPSCGSHTSSALPTHLSLDPAREQRTPVIYNTTTRLFSIPSLSRKLAAGRSSADELSSPRSLSPHHPIRLLLGLTARSTARDCFYHHAPSRRTSGAPRASCSFSGTTTLDYSPRPSRLVSSGSLRAQGIRHDDHHHIRLIAPRPCVHPFDPRCSGQRCCIPQNVHPSRLRQAGRSERAGRQRTIHHPPTSRVPVFLQG